MDVIGNILGKGKKYRSGGKSEGAEYQDTNKFFNESYLKKDIKWVREPGKQGAFGRYDKCAKCGGDLNETSKSWGVMGHNLPLM